MAASAAAAAATMLVDGGGGDGVLCLGNDVFWPSLSSTAAAGDGDSSNRQGQRGGKGEGKDGALLTACRCPPPHPPQGCQGGARQGRLTGSGHQGTGHAVLPRCRSSTCPRLMFSPPQNAKSPCIPLPNPWRHCCCRFQSSRSRMQPQV